ncbi:hypothetical protein GA0061074_12211 [Weissella bombi]|uniref:Uncharacterized protein n=1 Tax=Weissella bombi TaxID=1505725 RepID=A0A1C4C4X6_9LACO|nr:hypothetical protein GA0061074_12211 [Weissella bombi]
MVKYTLVLNGRHNGPTINFLPIEPQVGQLLHTADPKSPYYLIECITQSIDDEFVELHVKKFENKLSAVNRVNGFY